MESGKESVSHTWLKRQKPPPHIAKRSAKSGEGPSVPERAAAGKATREAAKALAHETTAASIPRMLNATRCAALHVHGQLQDCP